MFTAARADGRRPWFPMGVSLASIALVAGCATIPTGNPGSTATGTATPSGTASPASFIMPDQVGSNLQAAQDDIQRVSGDPLYISFSHDATGHGRLQILDRDWKVCSETPAPGTRVMRSIRITFNVVKLSETCP